MKNDKITTKQLMKYIKGPDFPTGGIVVNQDDLLSIYESGQREDQAAWKSGSGRIKRRQEAACDHRDSHTR